MTDEDALICDLAEEYHILNYRTLPPTLVASLSVGLRNDSRIKLKISGHEYGLREELLAIIADRLGTLIWFKTEDGQKGRNRPQSIYDVLTKKQEEKETQAFSSVEEFEREYNKLRGK